MTVDPTGQASRSASWPTLGGVTVTWAMVRGALERCTETGKAQTFMAAPSR